MIDWIELYNFKCFKEQRISLRPLTLLTGVNGMGKSTVLQSLLLLRQSYLQGMLPKRGLLINGDLIDLGTAGDILHRGADIDEMQIQLQYNGSSLGWKFGYVDQFDNVLPVISEPQDLGDVVIIKPHFHYLMAERIGPRAMYEMSTFAVEQEKQIGKDGRFAVAYLEANSTREVPECLRLNGDTQTTARAQVEAWLGQISPGAHLAIQPYPELGRLTLGMSFTTSSVSGRPFSARNVGFGLSYVLPVLVAVLLSPAGSLVLIENPEAHLNPKGQVAMGRLLALAAKAGIQTIVETHSDHILNGVRLAVKERLLAPDSVAIHYFDRRTEGEQTTHILQSPQLDANGRIESWPAGFFDQWEQSLDALLS